MNKLKTVLSILFLSSLVPVFAAQQVKAVAVNFGDYRSTTLVGKAWAALEKGDIESVLAYTNKCIEMYGDQARKMQASLNAFPTGSNEDIFKYWALNDVAASYYIQGEAYRRAGMKAESRDAFNTLINDFSYGQTWDARGWFWKLASGAKDKLAVAASGGRLDFGDYTSGQLVQKAWAALAAKDPDTVAVYVNKTVELYGAKAKEMQASLQGYAWESKEKIASYWALNDVGTAFFILGEAYRNAGKKEGAAQSYKQVIDEYSYAQCWDPAGWYWKPAEAAQQKLMELSV